MPTWTRDNISSASVMQQKEMDWVYASLYFLNEDERDSHKRQKTAMYNELFDRYSWAMENRPDSAGSPPVPAYALIVTGSVAGWSELAQSPTERVCAIKTYTPAAKPVLGIGKIGKRIGKSNFFVCLPGDITMPFEFQYLTSEDGVTGVFEKRANIQSSGAGSGKVEIPGVWELQPEQK